MLGAAPSVYRQILKQFKLGGNYGAYGASTAPGAGIVWKPGSQENPGDAKFSLSLNYTAKRGNKANPGAGGIGADNSGGKFLAQAAYGSPQWNVSAAYAYSQQSTTVGFGTPLGKLSKFTVTDEDGNTKIVGGGFQDANQISLRAWWQPEEAGWIPSISAGWGLTSYSGSKGGSYLSSSGSTKTWVFEDSDGNDRGYNPASTAQSWMIGLNWKDAFMKGNLLGFAIGQPQFMTSRDDNRNNRDYPDDGNYAMELYYQFQVTDNIAVTPTIFYLSRPNGELTGVNNDYGSKGGDSFNMFGYLVKTTFRF